MAEIFDTHLILTKIMTNMLDNLPREKWFRILELHQWEGFWYLFPHLEATIASQLHFQACDDDVLLASSMKTGTTWLKALIPCIMQSISDDDKDPLIMNHPNALMPSLEVQLYRGNPSPDLSSIPSPRLLRTHLPYAALSESIKKSNCKIVYITRNPKDTLISLWHFMNNSKPPGVDAVSLEVAFKSFCNGVHAFGPFFDHVMDYWKQSLDNPQKILFMKFEEMKTDPKGQVKKLAAFLGKPFTNDEEVEKVLWRCSLERLKNLEVNKTGIDPCIGVPNSSYFRQGIVGDWKNYFTSEMRKELDEITRIHLQDSGLEF